MPGFEEFTLSMVEYGGTADQMAGRCYRDTSDRRIELFKSLNYSDGRPTVSMPGQTLIVPHGTDYAPETVLRLRQSSQAMSQTARPVVMQQAEQYNSSWDILESLMRFDGEKVREGALEVATQSAEAYQEIVERSLKSIREDIVSLDALHRKSLRGVSGKSTARAILRSPEFVTQRRLLEQSIKQRMALVNDKLLYGREAGKNFRHSMGMTTKGVSIRAARGQTFTTPLAQANGRVSRALGTAKYAGKALKILSVAQLGNETYEAYEQGGAGAAAKTFAAGGSGLVVGAAVGKIAAGVVFGLSTGGIGFAILGIVAIAGASFVASEFTEYVVEESIDAMSANTTPMVSAK